MGAGASTQPVYLTRSTVLIAHTPFQRQTESCKLRRQSAAMTTGITSQMTMPLQFYPNNVYNNNGFTAEVHGFQAPQTNHNVSSTTSSYSQSTTMDTHRPSASNDDLPPSYTSVYPSLNAR